MNFKILNYKITKNGDTNLTFDVDHFQSRSKEFFTAENRPESWGQRRVTIAGETEPLEPNAERVEVEN